MNEVLCRTRFGMEQPTREMIEEWSARVDALDGEPLYRRWEGIYIVVYGEMKGHLSRFRRCPGTDLARVEQTGRDQTLESAYLSESLELTAL